MSGGRTSTVVDSGSAFPANWFDTTTATKLSTHSTQSTTAGTGEFGGSVIGV
jgi:hypothetical protein